MQSEIVEIIMKEVGKSLKDVRNEVVCIVDFICYIVEEVFYMNGESMKGDSFFGGFKFKVVIVECVFLGVVFVIFFFNYLVNLVVVKLVFVFILGNVVIFKFVM